jgi:pre-mRNA branch site protein p14
VYLLIIHISTKLVAIIIHYCYRGDKQETRGTAFVVYEDIYDAKNAVDHLSGFNVCGRYLVVLYYQATKMQAKIDNQKKKKEIDELK